MSHFVGLLDVETTGFEEPVIPVEVALGQAEGDDPRQIECNLINRHLFKPGKPIEWGAVSSHHILPEDLKDSPLWDPEYLAIPVHAYLVGHNIDYDWDAIGKPEPVKRICTLALSRYVCPEMDSHRLGAMIYSIFGQNAPTRERVQRAHSAVHDVRMLIDVIRYVSEQLGVKTWEALWEMSEIARVPKILTFGKNKGVAISEIDKHDPGYRRWLLKQKDIDPYLRKALEALGPT